jgi:hypothetical protein
MHMVKGVLPEEGALRIGAVNLAAGAIISANYGTGAPVAWATVDPVREAGAVWAALSGVHEETGLVPILLDGLGGDTRRPWDNGEFDDTAVSREPKAADVSRLLEDMWSDAVRYAEDAEAVRDRAPFGRRFPGMAPPEDGQLTDLEFRQALGSSLPSARIGLVPAERPADVLSVIGWIGAANRRDFLPSLTLVLRSWEDRFGARLASVGFADIGLFVERPPRTAESAQRIAVEHFLLADECAGGVKDIQGIAARLVNAPVWTLWWD